MPLKKATMKELKIMTQTPGLVVFDPQVLKEFVSANNVRVPNILENLIDDPGLGNQAISGGNLITIYSIPSWDYRVIVTEANESTLPVGWALFEAPPFVLLVNSGKIIVSDIWAIMNWDEETYLKFGEYPVDERYAAANEFKVSALVEVPNGRYRVRIIGFCDKTNGDIENRHCGYELLLVKDDNATFGVIGNIDTIDFDVVGLPA